MDVTRLEYLFDRYLLQACSKEEERELMALIAQPGNEVEIQSLINKLVENTGSEIKMPDQAAASVLQNILHSDRGLNLPFKDKNTIFKLWTRVAVAAAFILFMAGTIYWFVVKTHNSKATVASVAKKGPMILPGGNKAILIMSDGSTIVLDSVQNGMLQHGNTKVQKRGGLLIYSALESPSANTGPVAYNTLSTPRGGQFQIVLPDGSKVWLNASSSLRFPTAFTGTQRDVELTGEGYFEVAKNKEKPFHVKVNGMQVEVLGTHFNVNAYGDENSIKTSLLEGSVKIKDGLASGLLKPGEQGVLDENANKIKIKNVDMSEVVAWTNGLFQFDGAGITTIMKQIGRWYDVEIVYGGKVPIRSFQGKISRDAQLSDVLKILELSGVNFTIEGKKIIVQ